MSFAEGLFNGKGPLDTCKSQPIYYWTTPRVKKFSFTASLIKMFFFSSKHNHSIKLYKNFLNNLKPVTPLYNPRVATRCRVIHDCRLSTLDRDRWFQ